MAGYFKQRRLISLLVTAAVMTCFWSYLTGQENRLQRATWTSGYLLMTGVVFLAGFHLRKQLSFLPLGSSAAWMQLHIYVSFIVVGLFVFHVDGKLPDGVFETALYSLFVLTSVSGGYGLLLTRRIPRQISKLRQEVLYERISLLRQEVTRRAQAVVTQLVRRFEAEALADYYTETLIPFFVAPRGLAYYLRPTSRQRNRLLADLDALARYESVAEHAAERELRQLIDQRDDLDYHEAQQRKLKVWLFAHLALTSGLLLMASLHAVLVHAFGGAER